MNIFLTGGTGFIGSHFLKLALSNDHDILALRRSTSSQTKINLVNQPNWVTSSFEEVTVDQLLGMDCLVHLATHSGNVPYDDLLGCLSNNVFSVLQLFEKARIAGIKRFIVAGSCFEYGKSGEQFDQIPAIAPLLPTNSYAASKASASIALSQWADEHQISLEILRIFHVYGEGELDSRLWPSLRRAALGGLDFPMTLGEQIRDFQPVDRVVKLFLKRAVETNFQLSSKIYNIGTNKPSTILEFSQLWWDYFNATGSLLPGKIPYRTNEVMKYIPLVDLEI